MKQKFLKWFKPALIRAIRTMAQTMVALIGTSAMFSDVNWTMVVSSTLLAGLLSILTSIGGLPEVDNNTKEEDD